jgi:hypothetical protein
MKAEEWDKWVAHHGDLFSMHSTADAKLFKAWRPLLVNRSLVELKAASAAMAEDPEKAKSNRASHYGYIRAFLTSYSSARHKAEVESRDYGVCVNCIGSGYISVPHPKLIKNGEWEHPWYTFAVFCRCSRGAMKFNALSGGLYEKKQQMGGPELRPIGMDEYHQQFPNWQEMLAHREAIRRTEEGAAYAAREADRQGPTRARSVKDIMAQIGMEGGDE